MGVLRDASNDLSIMKKPILSLAAGFALLGGLAATAAETTPLADGLSPQAAAKAISMPAGFSATLCASEPDVMQPIAFAMDHRGRVWVAEAYSYPKRVPDDQAKDRILIFEDTKGNGVFDRRTVFIEGLNLISGLEVGFGGVFVGAAPNLYFIPIKEGEDKPAGPPEVLLDGWAYQDTHETLNTFKWGPDGWLYGCHGVFTHSNVGKPGAPDSERAKLNAGLWRYHPIKRVFEVFAAGTSNPWGVDFDGHGQAIIEACVIPHLFHLAQGGHYIRQAGQDFNPNIHDDQLINTIADHAHFTGNQWNTNDVSSSGSLGGGHAHAGMLIYQGASWPAEYNGRLFMNNILGSRINMDVPERKGSGFVAHHGADFVFFNDKWSQIVNLESDQDGAVYMIDWYDKLQCHTTDSKAVDRSNGRVLKIAYGNKPATRVDLDVLSEKELAALQTSDNIWQSAHARRALQERTRGQGASSAVTKQLLRIAEKDPVETHRLHALWALHATGSLQEETALKLLKSPSEYVRAWTIQSLCESKNPSGKAVAAFAAMAAADSSPVVRLYLASAAQRMSLAQRRGIVEALVARGEDAEDPNLPYMYYYAVEPLAGAQPADAAALLTKTKIPRLREWITRRMTSGAKTSP
jgi:putative membrane-bound dehydrogenase-like protein